MMDSMLACEAVLGGSAIVQCYEEETYLVGIVDNEETISLGKLDLKAPRQLIVLGTCHVVRIEGDGWQEKGALRH